MRLFAENYTIGFKFFDRYDNTLYEVVENNKFKVREENGNIHYWNEIDIYIPTIEEDI